MPIKEISHKAFQTSDGKEFQNIKSAELWEEILTQRKEFFDKFQITEFQYAFWKPEPIFWINIKNIEDDKKYIEEKYKITSGLENLFVGWNIVTILGSSELTVLDPNLIRNMYEDIKLYWF